MAKARIDNGRLRLTREDRAALFNGERPSLTFVDAPEVGAVYALSSKVSLRIKSCRELKGGFQLAEYVLTDERPRLLRSSLPRPRLALREDAPWVDLDAKYDDHGNREPVDQEAVHRGAEESAYTASKFTAMPREPEPVDRETQKAFSLEARSRMQEQREEEGRRQQERMVRERIREVLRGLSPLGQAMLLAGIEREIQRALNTERRDAA